MDYEVAAIFIKTFIHLRVMFPAFTIIIDSQLDK